MLASQSRAVSTPYWAVSSRKMGSLVWPRAAASRYSRPVAQGRASRATSSTAAAAAPESGRVSFCWSTGGPEGAQFA